ncbi:MAG: hypothetical protein QM802_02320 [Agriterribacter sp.]
MEDATEDIKIKFDGQTHQIEANTLINSLLHFTNIVQEINKDLDTGRSVIVKINALPPGSFLIHISVESLIDAAQQIFSKENLAVAKEIVNTVKEVFNLYKFLKGKKPKEIVSKEATTTIVNNNGDTYIFNNATVSIYQNNRVVKEAIAQEFETLNNDQSVTGLELLDVNDKQLFVVPKEEFPALSNVDHEETLPDERIIPKTGMLNIYTLSFDPNVKWTFYYEGNKITAKISSDFVTRIDNGEQFSKGDSLKAEFEIKQQFDAGVNDYINKSHKIIRIIEHIPRAKQNSLFDKTPE